MLQGRHYESPLGYAEEMDIDATNLIPGAPLEIRIST